MNNDITSVKLVSKTNSFTTQRHADTISPLANEKTNTINSSWELNNPSSQFITNECIAPCTPNNSSIKILRPYRGGSVNLIRHNSDTAIVSKRYSSMPIRKTKKYISRHMSNISTDSILSPRYTNKTIRRANTTISQLSNVKPDTIKDVKTILKDVDKTLTDNKFPNIYYRDENHRSTEILSVLEQIISNNKKTDDRQISIQNFTIMNSIPVKEQKEQRQSQFNVNAASGNITIIQPTGDNNKGQNIIVGENNNPAPKRNFLIEKLAAVTACLKCCIVSSAVSA